MPNSKRAQTAQSSNLPFILPFPWRMSQPWQTVTKKHKKEKEENEKPERETAWICTHCGADHHNARKQTCRVCGEARSTKVNPKSKQSSNKRAVAAKVGTPPAGEPHKEPSSEVPRFQVSKQMGEYIAKMGHKLHTVAIPETQDEAQGDEPESLSGLSLERLQTAHDGLVALKMPDSIIRPLREELEERKAKQSRVYDPAKRLEQFTAQRNRTLKLKEELQAEVDDQRAKLAAAEGRLAKAAQDLEFFQEEINKAMAETNDANGAVKRAREMTAGTGGIKSALDQTDEALASHPDYIAHLAAAYAAGLPPLTPLRWHVQKELQTLATDTPTPAAKRACTSSSPARQLDADGDEQIL